jgi:hypothetical protein
VFFYDTVEFIRSGERVLRRGPDADRGARAAPMLRGLSRHSASISISMAAEVTRLKDAVKSKKFKLEQG